MGHTSGILTKADIVIPYVMSVNGAGISVSNEVWQKMKPNVPLQPDGKPVHPISAAAMKPVVEDFKNQGFLEVSLGTPILRVEIATFAALGQLHLLLEGGP